MYIDLILLIILMIIVIMFFKRFSSFVFFIAVFDIFFRILTFIKLNIPLADVAAVMDKYIPTGVLGIIAKYSDGIFTTILNWAYVVIMMIFWFYVTRIFLRKKKV
ncbi:MAG: hypothetical protein J6A17_00960 [Bacilli bacterium]|nr:hypothetical protein [Bacilli bacterium]